MEGVGPGTTLSGRYVVSQRLQQVDGAERWAARDQELGRDVCLLVVPADDSRAPALLDAARMTAAISHPVLLRVLDIDTDGPVSFVVEESTDDAVSLADLVRSNGLPGGEVRRITGEAATGLQVAGTREVHHLRLTADDVFRTTDGEIRLRGLGTAAALAGAEATGEDAARTDAVSIVALTYAGLTGLAPLPGHEGSLPPAPRLPHGVVAPSEIAAGVPRDLDALARLTLVDDAGPTSPGDYARQIAPWSTRQVGVPDAAPGRADRAGDPAEVPGLEPVTAGVSAAGAAAGAGRSPAASSGAGTDTLPLGFGPTGRGQGGPAAGAVAAGAVAAGAVAAAVRGGAPSPAGGRTVSGTASGGTGPAAFPGPAPGQLPPHDPQDLQDAELEPPAPFLPAEPLRRNQTVLAMSLVLLFVLGSLAVGIWGITKIGSNTHLDFGSGVVATPSPTPTTSQAPTQDTLKKLGVLSANGFDPQGDQTENDKLAPKVFDGNPQTAWTSEGYLTANLGGLKQGVGVIVDLGTGVTPAKVDLVLQAQADVSVYIGTDRSLDGAVKIGSQAGATGTVSFTVKDPQPGQFVIVWFTQLTQDGDGYYRAKLGEVTVYG